MRRRDPSGAVWYSNIGTKTATHDPLSASMFDFSHACSRKGCERMLSAAAKGRTARDPVARRGVGNDGGNLAKGLESSRRDHLEDAARLISRIPQRLPISTRLEHPRARGGEHDLVA
jgi:hypothetical protein